MKFSGIRAKLNIVGGLFTLVLIVLVLVVVFMNNKQKKDAYIVNMAGLQRMLTQKMTKEVLYLQLKESSDFRELNNALDLFSYNLVNLINGNKNKGIDPPSSDQTKLKLQDVKAQWIPFKEEILKVQKSINYTKYDISMLNVKTEKLLSLSEVIVDLMIEAKLNSTYIDISGRQRMLSQRMGLFARKYLKNSENDSIIFFNDAKKLYDETIKSFLEDQSIKQHQELYKQVQKTYKYWQEYIKFMDILLKEENLINQSIEYIFQHNTKLLATVDEVVTLYTQDSENKNHQFMNIIYIISILAIMITIYAYILTKDVILHVDDFVDKAKRLATFDVNNPNDLLLGNSNEDELDEATSHIRDYVKRVNQAMQHSNDTISKAESVADELQKLALSLEKAMENLNIDEKEKHLFNKKVSAAEDIAIQSTEDLIHVSKMLTKLQTNLADMTNKANKN